MCRPLGLAACALLSSICSAGLAFGQNSCTADLPIDPTPNIDGTLIFRMKGEPWKPLQATDQLPATGVVQFVYVVRESWGSDRSGVVVIKSGSYSPTTADARHPNSVFLARPGRRGDPSNGTCGRISIFLPRYVAATSYDRYHDLGVSIPQSDNDALTAYHIHYMGRGGVCRDTNNTDYDSPLRLDRRSNRSQFSFDTDVVASGMASQVASSFGFGSALAGAVGFSNAKSEIRRYHTDGNKMACIPFSLNILGAGYFLRIDDLDASQQDNLFVRTREKTWRLTQ
jgi:hypothetical protein